MYSYSDQTYSPLALHFNWWTAKLANSRFYSNDWPIVVGEPPVGQSSWWANDTRWYTYQFIEDILTLLTTYTHKSIHYYY